MARPVGPRTETHLATKQQCSCTKYSWHVTLFYLSHHEIENKPLTLQRQSDDSGELLNTCSDDHGNSRTTKFRTELWVSFLPTFTSPSAVPVRTQAARPVAALGRRAEHLLSLLNPASIVAQFLLLSVVAVKQQLCGLRSVLGQLLFSHCAWCEQQPIFMLSIRSQKYFGARGSEHWLQVQRSADSTDVHRGPYTSPHSLSPRPCLAEPDLTRHFAYSCRVQKQALTREQIRRHSRRGMHRVDCHRSKRITRVRAASSGD